MYFALRGVLTSVLQELQGLTIYDFAISDDISAHADF